MVDLSKLTVANLKAICSVLKITPTGKKADIIAQINGVGLSDEDLIKKMGEAKVAVPAAKASKKTTAKASSAATAALESRIVDLEARLAGMGNVGAQSQGTQTAIVSDKAIQDLETKITAMNKKTIQELETKISGMSTKINELYAEIRSLKCQPKVQQSTSSADADNIKFILKKIQDLDRAIYSRNKSEDEIGQDDIEEAKARIEEAFSNIKTNSLTFDELMDRPEMKDISWFAVVKGVEELVEDDFVQLSDGKSTKKYKGQYGRLTFQS